MMYRYHPFKLLRVRTKSAFATASEIFSVLRSKKIPLTLQESTAIIQYLQMRPLECYQISLQLLFSSLRIWLKENINEFISILSTFLDSHNLKDSSTIVTAVTILGCIPTTSNEGRAFVCALDKNIDECNDAIILTNENVKDILNVASAKEFPVVLKFAKKLFSKS